MRSGPPLMAGLRAFCSGTGGALPRHQPQTRALNLISCGRRRAIASWGGWSTEGRWVWWWKNHLDRRFVARYAVAARREGGRSAPVAPVTSTTPTSSP